MTLQSDFNAKITKVKTALENVFVKKTDIKTSFSSTTSDGKIPSEKLVKDSLDTKQASLVSGTNIKTVNNESLLGSGNISIPTKTSDLTNDSGFLTSLPSHNHDDRYYTETEVDTALNGKANSSHSHSISDVTSLQTSLNDKIEASDLLELIYPIGSIYMSVNSTSPATLFGGTWARIKDTFLLASGDTYSSDGNVATAQHGSATVTLTANQSGVPAHQHGMAHTHNHNHTAIGYVNTGGAGTARRIPIGYDNTSAAGTLATGSDSTASSKSNTDNNTAQDASEAHSNMPPYMAVYVWKRTA